MLGVVEFVTEGGVGQDRDDHFGGRLLQLGVVGLLFELAELLGDPGHLFVEGT